MASFFIHLAALLPEKELDADDRLMSGVYEVECDRDESDPHTITAVLDAFHEKIGIASLDDFEIGVKNAAGQWVDESENEDDPDPLDMPSATYLGQTDGIPEQFTKPATRPSSKLSP